MPEPCPTIWPHETVWHHETLRWWAVLLRACGYTGRLPRWAVRRCTATWPMEMCQCHLYRISWAQASWEGDDHAGKE